MDADRLKGPLGQALARRIREADEDRRFTADLAQDTDSYLDGMPAASRVGEEGAVALRQGIRALIRRQLQGLTDSMYRASNLCDSPIEGVMLGALLLVAAERDMNVALQLGYRDEQLTTLGMPSLVVTPQAQIGEYRVDFLLEYRDVVPDFSVKEKARDGTEIPGSKDVSSRVVVECDGHDFHERTKQQASRDRQRDRSLQATGYMIFRYTGSDLWRDPVAAADEVLAQLARVSEEW